MDHRMSWNEIKDSYPQQWVSLLNVEKNEDGEIQSGVVVGAGADLKSLMSYLKRQNLKSKHLEFTGKIKNFLGVAKWEIENVQAR